MADKFLRSGGRGDDGTAKPFRTNNQGDQYVQLTGSIVQDYHEGNTNYSNTYQSSMTGVSIANDGLENLTFTISGVTRTVYPSDVYNATLQPFTTIQINAVDYYRLEVLQ